MLGQQTGEIASKGKFAQVMTGWLSPAGHGIEVAAASLQTLPLMNFYLVSDNFHIIQDPFPFLSSGLLPFNNYNV